jgi:integrase
VSEEDNRIGFTLAPIRALDELLGAEYQITDDDRWLPIVCAYEGCRQKEACQLLKSDVYQQPGGMWVMRITGAGDGQKVKNRASVRKLPVHQQLIERGFLDHVSRSAGPLVFATLKPDQRGRLGGSYGKRFARHLHKRTKITDPNLSFHSLRHSWATAARNAELPETIQKALMGHAQGGAVTSRYGDLADPAVLAPWLNQVDPFADPDAAPISLADALE